MLSFFPFGRADSKGSALINKHVQVGQSLAEEQGLAEAVTAMCPPSQMREMRRQALKAA